MTCLARLGVELWFDRSLIDRDRWDALLEIGD